MSPRCEHHAIRMGPSVWTCQDCGASVGRETAAARARAAGADGYHAEANAARDHLREHDAPVPPEAA